MSINKEAELSASSLQPLMTKQQFANWAGVSVKSLQRQRCQGVGFPYIKLGRGRNAAVRYYMPHVLDYLERHKCVPSVEAIFLEVSHGPAKAR